MTITATMDITQKSNLPKWTDFHSHILPAFDDGSASVEISRQMVRRAVSQRVTEIVATPHFKYTDESPLSFACRRDACLKDLQVALQGENNLPAFSTGAEIMLSASLEGLDLSPLVIKKYNAMLLELPFTGYRPWMVGTLENIANKYHVILILAHFERYPEIVKNGHLSEILSIPRLVIQFNNPALRSHSAVRTMQHLLKNGHPVILGSDAHNDTERPFSFDIPNKILEKRTFSNRGAYDVLQEMLSYHATIPAFDNGRP